MPRRRRGSSSRRRSSSACCSPAACCSSNGWSSRSPMSSEAIRVEHLAKQYRLGTSRGAFSYGSLRETVSDAAAAWWQRLSGGQPDVESRKGDADRFIWALNDVSFSVSQGEVLGIIGRNGAGKSTLLKILSRITRPTRGLAEFRGRLGSLLEVGTGFHPELSGRDNVYLNGAILGMRRAEIQRKFDDIVDFSGVSAFIDTPVKRYSSGMYVRLGFAVAAHLEPEILVVDEVLAVGDMAFQKRCLGKMGQFGDSGRTILFVSHNIPAVLSLCQKGIVLEKGRLKFEGDAKRAVDYYVGAVSRAEREDESHVIDLWNNRGRLPQYQPWLRRLEVYTGQGEPFKGELPIGAAIRIHVQFDLQGPIANFDARVNFVNLYGQVIFAARSSY